MKSFYNSYIKIRKPSVIIVFLIVAFIQIGKSQNVINTNDLSSKTKISLKDTLYNKLPVIVILQTAKADTAVKQNIKVAAPTEKKIMAVSKSFTMVSSQKLLLIKNDTILKKDESITNPFDDVKIKAEEK